MKVKVRDNKGQESEWAVQKIGVYGVFVFVGNLYDELPMLLGKIGLEFVGKVPILGPEGKLIISVGHKFLGLIGKDPYGPISTYVTVCIPSGIEVDDVSINIGPEVSVWHKERIDSKTYLFFVGLDKRFGAEFLIDLFLTTTGIILDEITISEQPSCSKECRQNTLPCIRIKYLSSVRMQEV